MAEVARSDRGFDHLAVVYDDSDYMVDFLVPFIEDGITAGDRVLLEVSDKTRGVVDGLLPSPGVHDGFLGDLLSHPHQALWGLRQYVDDTRSPDERVRVVSEIDYAVPLSIRSDWGRVESLVNHVFGHDPMSIVCLFDASRVEADVLDLAQATHPDVLQNGQRVASAGYESTRTYLTERDTGWASDPLEAVAADLTLQLATIDDVRSARAALDDLLVATSLSEDRKEDYRTAVFEVAVNALLYGGDVASLMLWRSGDRILCRVRDDGAGLPDPLTGYLPPDPAIPGSGHGLWLARQLSDHMTTTAEPPGCTVRLSVFY